MKHLTLAAVLLVAACNGGEGDNSSDEAANMTEEAPPAPAPGPPPQTPLSASPTPSTASGGVIPASFHGRWGMVDNDCIPGRDDAKGLMIVTADGLGFYESRGRVEKLATTTPGTLTLDLAFTGEGQEWNRRETLTLLEEGRTLVREEQKPAGSFRYIKCPEGRE